MPTIEQVPRPVTQLAVYRDGQLAPEYLPAVPTALEQVGSMITSSIGKLASKAVLEGRLLGYDAIHGTNYRQIKHEVTRRDREERFITSIGLMRIVDK